MLMLKCKTCGNIFSALYVVDTEGFKEKFKIDSNVEYYCPRGHSNQYVLENYIDLS